MHYLLKICRNTNIYLTVEDLAYKPDIIQRAKSYPLGEPFNKAFKKDGKNKKVMKYSNDLFYNSAYNFNKYSLPNFNEISSIDSKFDTINKFYKHLVKSNNLRTRDDKKQNKVDVVKNATQLYSKWIDIYKKE